MPARKRELVGWLRASYSVSKARACRLVLLQPSSYYYQAKRNVGNEVLKQRIKEIAAARVRFGYRRITVLLRRESWKVNAKRVYRLYRQEDMQLSRKKPKKKRASHQRVASVQAERVNQKWSMDFVTDLLVDGRYFRILAVVDQFTRECIALHAGQSLRGSDVARSLSHVVDARSSPESITVDNGSEFCSQVMDTWAYRNKVQLEFIRPGKPVENHYIESFNGGLRDECLNLHLFFNLKDAQDELDLWREDYNLVRPHGSLGEMTPQEFASQC